MKNLTLFFTKLIERYLPDAFVFAIILSAMTILLGWILGIGSLSQQIDSWAGGLWDLNNFAMQMAMILITGSTLAKTNPVRRLIHTLTNFATTPVKASLLVTIVTTLACLFNWGLGLVVGALIATEVAARMKKANYALLLANAYSGFLVWHGGISGSIPLKLTDPTGIFANIVASPVPLSKSLGSGLNLTLLVVNIAVILGVNIYLAKHFGSEINGQLPVLNSDDSYIDEGHEKALSFAEKIEDSKWAVLVVFGLLVVYILRKVWGQGTIDLNLLITIFLALSLIFSGTIKNFLDKFITSVQDAAGILLQFPFYAAIMAVMASSGLAKLLSEFFVDISNEHTFLFFTYLAAGVLNFFVPSGGGQWAIQGPIMLPAAQNLGVDITQTAMAIAWGDAWTNMIQPFWALPLLSVAKIKMQKLMSYTVVVFVATGLASGLCFVLWSKIGAQVN